MALNEDLSKSIIKFVKKEPRTIQEISKHIKKSWVTTDTYIKQIQERTGQVNLKTFRKGTQGALKLVYYNYSDSLLTDEVKEYLYYQIKNGRKKTDFDFMEIFQFIPDKEKKSFIEEFESEHSATFNEVYNLFQQATNQVFCFSGNLSFINLKEKNKKILDIMEDMLQRKIRFKILCRINISSLSNINKLKILMQKYPNMIEIKHSYQPLRGFVIDENIARFRNEENLKDYKSGELNKNTRIVYEIYNNDWIIWLQKVFWNIFRPSIDYNTRLQEIIKLDQKL